MLRASTSYFSYQLIESLRWLPEASFLLKSHGHLVNTYQVVVSPCPIVEVRNPRHREAGTSLKTAQQSKMQTQQSGCRSVIFTKSLSITISCI